MVAGSLAARPAARVGDSDAGRGHRSDEGYRGHETTTPAISERGTAPPRLPDPASRDDRGAGVFRRLPSILQCRRVLAPEVVGSGRDGSEEVGPWCPRAYQFLARTQPVSRQANDVVTGPSRLGGVFGFPVRRVYP